MLVAGVLQGTGFTLGCACRCYSTNEHGSAAFLVKMTHLLQQDYLGKLARKKPAEPDSVRINELAECINLEASMLEVCQAACSFPSASVSLHHNTCYLLMQ